MIISFIITQRYINFQYFANRNKPSRLQKLKKK